MPQELTSVPSQHSASTASSSAPQQTPLTDTTAGNGEIRAAVPNASSSMPQMTLEALPLEILDRIVQDTGETSTTIFNLARVAREFSNFYTPHLQRYLAIKYHLDQTNNWQTQAVSLPLPDSPQWKSIRDDTFPRAIDKAAATELEFFEVSEKYHQNIRTKAYIKTWELLMAPNLGLSNRQISDSMHILLKLTGFFTNRENYTSASFGNPLSDEAKASLQMLIQIDPDASIRLMAKHMPASAVKELIADALQMPLDNAEEFITAIKASGNDVSLLQVAVGKKNIDWIKALLFAQIDINQPDGAGYTALMHAAMSGNPDICTLLLQYGAKINAVDKDGYSALSYAVAATQRQLTASRIPALAALLAHPEVNVNLQNIRGETALIEASRAGNKQAVEMLLKLRHLNLTQTNARGESALMIANAYGHRDVAALLSDVSRNGSNGNVAESQ